MQRKILILVAFFLTVGAAFWGGKLWGWSAAEAEMAEAREEAIRDAVAQDRRERARAAFNAQERERKRLQELRSRVADLQAKNRRAREWQSSQAAQRECFPPDALKIFRSY